MPFTLTMPKLSPTMEEGTIAKWYKNEGDFVKSGDLLLEVSTDKATVEYNALDKGWLRKITISDGDAAAVNQVIAIFSEDKHSDIQSLIPVSVEVEEKEVIESTATQPNKTVTPAAVTFAQPQFAPESPLENYTFNQNTDSLSGRLLASPLAKKLAKEKGLDITTVKGSGPRGRIMSKDLPLAQTVATVTFGSRKLPTEVPGSYEEEKLSPMRKIIGQRLQEAKTFIPHFYVSHSVDASQLVATRQQLVEGGIKVTFNDFVIRACALALREHPEVNAGYNTKNLTITRYKTIDIAIAVTVAEGLITPIIRHADFKNLGELSVEAKYLSNKAREGKLDPAEYKGGSFTISNLGMFGVTEFIAIINPPQAAILSVGGIQDVPVVKEGAVVAGKMMNITLSCDHRVVDGVAGAKFLNTVKRFLENPALLIV